MRSSGFYREHPAEIRIDPHVVSSVVSVSYASRFSLPGTVSRADDGTYRHVATGPVLVLGIKGIFVATLPCLVGYVDSADVLLGQDWLAAVQTQFVDDRLAEAELAWVRGAFAWFEYSFQPDILHRPPDNVFSYAGPVLQRIQDWAADRAAKECVADDVAEGPSGSAPLSGTRSREVFPGERPDVGASGTSMGDVLPDTEDSSGNKPAQSPFDSVSRRRVAEVRRQLHIGHTAVIDFPAFNRSSRVELVAMMSLHGLDALRGLGCEHFRTQLTSHIADGDCVLKMGEACRMACAGAPSNAMERRVAVRVAHLKQLSKSISRQSLYRLCDVLRCSFDRALELKVLRRALKQFAVDLNKGKHSALVRAARIEETASRPTLSTAQADELRANWPQVPSPSLKERLVRIFREETSSAALKTNTCAVCGHATLESDCRSSLLDDLPLNLLTFPPELRSFSPSLPVPYKHTVHGDMLLNPQGIDEADVHRITVLCCSTCHLSLGRQKIPPLSYANGLYLGPVPQELQDLTIVEEALISRCRAKAWVVHLRADGTVNGMNNAQRGLRGNIVIHPQRPDALCRVLPPPMEDILNPICIIFVGSQKPTKEWLRTKAKPLAVRRQRVTAALRWLKANNPLYSDIAIDINALNKLPIDDVLDYDIQVLPASSAQQAATAGYTANADVELGNASTDLAADTESPTAEPSEELLTALPFHAAVIADVDVHSPSSELRAAAVRHFKEKGGGFVSVPHEPSFMNEFFNPQLFPMIYPTLFPYGVGGFEDRQGRPERLSMKRHVTHLFNCSDHRFQVHYSFLFVVFNLLQRREVLLRAGLKAKKQSFQQVATEFSSLDPEAIARICQRVVENEGKPVKPRDVEEEKVLKLMKEVKLVTSTVPGSPAARQNLRNNIRGMMIEHGLPSFYLTINPADVYNPVVKLLGGSDIDVDCMDKLELPEYGEQSHLVARNPFAAAKFFNIYMKAFIKCLLGFDEKAHRATEDGGVLGHVKAYFGCVEAQGRGTLHCHMLVWLEGSLNPNEIRERLAVCKDVEFGQRLLAYLDDAVSTGIPDLPPVPSDCEEHFPFDSPVHPCKTRGVPLDVNGSKKDYYQSADLHRLAKACQTHTHSFTCYKYCREGEKECRFGLSASNVRLESAIDPVTGDIHLQCLDGLVNNFNATMLEAIRCNMDIKFIGSGDAAKAILYYITDYITKGQLKTHVAFAALELAIRKLNDQVPHETEAAFRAKRMLQKCAYAMLTQQELSAPQVISSLANFEDFFSSDRFAFLYWTSYEAHIERLLPSPECRLTHVDEAQQATGVLTDEQVESMQADTEGLPQSCTDDVEEGSVSEEDDDESALWNEFEPDDPGGVENLVGEFVSTEVNSQGELAPVGDRVSDYVHRPEALANVGVWDFVQGFVKVNPKSQLKVNDDQENLEEAHLVDDSVEDEETVAVQNATRFRFLRAHPECDKRILRGVKGLLRPTLVPIGPSFPRRERVEIRAKYCRLMLILFKPWRVILDLKPVEMAWTDAFDAWLPTVDDASRRRMDNMQILHECKDCRDEHYRTRHLLQKKDRVSAELVNGAEEGDWGPGTNDDDLLDYLDQFDNHGRLVGGLTTSEEDDVNKCLRAAENHELFSALFAEHAHDMGKAMETEADEFVPYDSGHEHKWQDVYKARKDLWKRRLAGKTIDSDLTSNEVPTMNGEHAQTWFDSLSSQVEPCVGQLNHEQPRQDLVELVNELVAEFTLNDDQAYAFRTIALHSGETHDLDDRLRMYLGGPGGSGKSRVINTLKAFFDRRHESRRFRLASFTGVAARNISGMTLHSCLMIDQRNVSREDLAAIWEGVDYLMIDEVSMVGCHLLAQVSKTLSFAKGLPDIPFGGINMVFAGDFAQLPPVGQARLYAYMNPSKPKFGQNSRSQSELFGRLLWLSITSVILLSVSMRQMGVQNRPFVELLTRLREGDCHHGDWLTLSNRVLSVKRCQMDSKVWKNAPTIVSSNAVKDAMNIRAVEAYSAATGKPLNWYYSVDRTAKKTAQDLSSRARQNLQSRHSGVTKQRLGKIPLVLGMQILVSSNFDVPGGVVNGSVGVLKRVRYYMNSEGQRILKSCIVHLPDANGGSVEDLPDNWYPILPDEVTFQLSNGRKKGQCSVKRKQVPIQPAYAFTAHRAQGQSYEYVVVDLQGCQTLEAVYVMVSRAKSLDGLAILRPFDVSKLQARLDKDRKAEYTRLHTVSLYTAIRYGDEQRKVAALLQLSTIRGEPMRDVQGIPSDSRDMVSLLQDVQPIPFAVRSSGSRKRDARYEPVEEGARKRLRRW